MRKKTAVIIGATGLVGKQLVHLMLKEDLYDSIIVVTRRSLELENSIINEIIIEDFNKLSDFKSKLNAHHFYCALGTTMKKAGSEREFLKTDVEYPLEYAKMAKEQPDFQQFLVISSVGANSSSPLLYNKSKGQLEDKLQELGIKSLKIFRPSLLLGERKETRFYEEIAKLISAIASFFLVGYKRKVGAIRDVEVAKAMLKVARENKEGFEIFKPNQMIKMAYS